MRLLVDIGNTRVKWACDAGSGHLIAGTSFPSDIDALPGEFQRHWGGIERPSAVWVCNVKGAELEPILTDGCTRLWGMAPRWIRSAPQAHGIVNAYADPSRLGADRWVAMIGAAALFGLPVCVVSLGTAVTVDLVDADGRHRGGLIAPGLGLMKDSVLQRAEGVRPEAAVERSAFWGRDSGACLKSGVVQMTIALVERAVRQAHEDLLAEPTVVLTGGDAATIAPRLSIRHEQAPDLVLEGLARYET
ncbi:type III pantothenate kinase [Methylolobus aquaticus]|nr:type III pantothenate kinase [Methylolobus aquaticus]